MGVEFWGYVLISRTEKYRILRGMFSFLSGRVINGLEAKMYPIWGHTEFGGMPPETQVA